MSLYTASSRAVAPRGVKQQQCLAPKRAAPRQAVIMASANTEVDKSAKKRIPSAFNLFYKAKYKDVKALRIAQGLAASLSDCNAQLRAMWETLAEQDKAQYEQESSMLKSQLAAERGEEVASPSRSRSRSPTAAEAFTNALGRAKDAVNKAASPQMAFKAASASANISSVSPRPDSPSRKSIKTNAAAVSAAPRTSSAESDPAFPAYAKATLPSIKSQYPDLDEADLKSVLAYKFSKLSPAEKDAFARQGKLGGSSPSSSSSYTPAASSSVATGDFAAFAKAEMPALKRQYPDLSEGDLQNLLKYKFNKANSPAATPTASRGNSRPASPAPAARAASPAPSYSSSSYGSSSSSANSGDFAAFSRAELPALKKEYPDLSESDLQNLLKYRFNKKNSPTPPVARKPATRPATPAAARSSTPTRTSTPSYSAPSYSSSSSSANSGDFAAFAKAELPALKKEYPDLSESDLQNLLKYRFNKKNNPTPPIARKPASRPATPAPARSSTPTRSSSPAPSYSAPSYSSSSSSANSGDFAAFSRAELPALKKEYPDLSESDLQNLLKYRFNKKNNPTPAIARKPASRPASPAPAPARSSSPAPSYSAPSYNSSSSSANSGDFAAFAKAELPALKKEYPDLSESDLQNLLKYRFNKKNNPTPPIARKPASRPATPAPARSSTPTRSSSPAPSYSAPSYSSSSSSSANSGDFAAFSRAELPALKKEYPDLSESDLQNLLKYRFNKKNNPTPAIARKPASRPASPAPAPARSSSPAPSYSAPSYSSSSSSSANSGDFAAFSRAELPALKKEYPDLSESDLQNLLKYRFNKKNNPTPPIARKPASRPATPAPARSSTPTRSSSPAPSYSAPSYSSSSSSSANSGDFAAFAKAELPALKKEYPDLSESDLQNLLKYRFNKKSSPTPAVARKPASRPASPAPAPARSSSPARPQAQSARAAAPKPMAPAAPAPSSTDASKDPALAAFIKAEMPKYKAQYPDLQEKDLTSLIVYRYNKLPQNERAAAARAAPAASSAPASRVPAAASNQPSWNPVVGAALASELEEYVAKRGLNAPELKAAPSSNNGAAPSQSGGEQPWSPLAKFALGFTAVCVAITTAGTQMGKYPDLKLDLQDLKNKTSVKFQKTPLYSKETSTTTPTEQKSSETEAVLPAVIKSQPQQEEVEIPSVSEAVAVEEQQHEAVETAAATESEDKEAVEVVKAEEEQEQAPAFIIPPVEDENDSVEIPQGVFPSVEEIAPAQETQETENVFAVEEEEVQIPTPAQEQYEEQVYESQAGIETAVEEPEVVEEPAQAVEEPTPVLAGVAPQVVEEEVEPVVIERPEPTPEEAAFALFARNEIENLKAIDPQIVEDVDLINVIYHGWSQLTPEDKGALIKQAQAEREEEERRKAAEVAEAQYFQAASKLDQAEVDPAYALFVNAELPSLKEDFPGMAETDLKALLSHMWSQLPQPAKDALAEKAAQDAADKAAAEKAAAEAAAAEALAKSQFIAPNGFVCLPAN